MQEADINGTYLNRLAWKVHMTCRTHDFLLCDTLSLVVVVDESHVWSAHHLFSVDWSLNNYAKHQSCLRDCEESNDLRSATNEDIRQARSSKAWEGLSFEVQHLNR